MPIDQITENDIEVDPWKGEFPQGMVAYAKDSLGLSSDITSEIHFAVNWEEGRLHRIEKVKLPVSSEVDRLNDDLFTCELKVLADRFRALSDPKIRKISYEIPDQSDNGFVIIGITLEINLEYGKTRLDRYQVRFDEQKFQILTQQGNPKIENIDNRTKAAIFAGALYSSHDYYIQQVRVH